MMTDAAENLRNTMQPDSIAHRQEGEVQTEAAEAVIKRFVNLRKKTEKAKAVRRDVQ